MREEMIQAAIADLEERGFQESSLQSIAERSDFDASDIAEEFGDLHSVHNAVLQHFVRTRLKQRLKRPEELGELMAYAFQIVTTQKDYVHLLMNESLHSSWDEILEKERRFAMNAEHKKSVDQYQERGQLDRLLDPECFLLFLTAVTYFPVAFPHITRLITNRDGDSAEFKARWCKFLHRLAEKLEPEK